MHFYAFFLHFYSFLCIFCCNYAFFFRKIFYRDLQMFSADFLKTEKLDPLTLSFLEYMGDKSKYKKVMCVYRFPLAQPPRRVLCTHLI